MVELLILPAILSGSRPAGNPFVNHAVSSLITPLVQARAVDAKTWSIQANAERAARLVADPARSWNFNRT
jgi:hypothetical protein